MRQFAQSKGVSTQRIGYWKKRLTSGGPRRSWRCPCRRQRGRLGLPDRRRSRSALAPSRFAFEKISTSSSWHHTRAVGSRRSADVVGRWVTVHPHPEVDRDSARVGVSSHAIGNNESVGLNRFGHEKNTRCRKTGRRSASGDRRSSEHGSRTRVCRGLGGPETTPKPMGRVTRAFFFRYFKLTLLPQISATRSIVGAAIIPLKLTEQADFSMLRSEAGRGVAARFVYRGDSDGLAVVCVGSAPNLQIVICRCQDCGSNVKITRECPMGSRG